MKRNRESDETSCSEVDDGEEDVVCSADQQSEEPNSKKQIENSSHTVSRYLKEGHVYYARKDYDEAMKLFMKGAEEGCVECKHKIGYLYDCGLGVLKDHSKALEWYLQAATVLSTSQHNIGILYENGQGVEQDYSKAMEWYLKSAENNGDAQYNIGMLHDLGLGVPQDLSKAMEWYLKAAENKQVDAQYNIGQMYHTGSGVEKDYSKAMEWYLKAAKCNHANAQYNIGILYDNGQGVEQDFSKAMEWYLKAAENKQVDAQYNIGQMYHTGSGIEKDYSKAMEWYLKAAKCNHANAQYNIGILYDNGQGVEQDFSKAMEWYLKAAENNHVDAQFNIGQMYHTGLEVEKDYSKAMEWYLKAGNNDHREAQYNVGVLYLNGERGIEKDLKKAIFWMTKSLNDHFDLIETPYEQFALKDFALSEESSTTKIIGNETDQVIIRFEERDFSFPNNCLEKSKYLSTMMSDNWKDLNEKDGNQIILDLRPIQNDIFQEPSDQIQIFENYLNYLTNNSVLSALDMDAKFKLIELSRYLGDDECILNIVKEATLLMRFYILLKMERVEPLHIAIASCFATGPSFAINDLSENIAELLLNQSEITSKAKQNIVEAFTNKFKKNPNNTHLGNKALHITLSKQVTKQEFNFKNQDISFTLESCEDNNKNILKINSSHNLEFFGENVKFYIQIRNEGNIGFWLKNCETKSNTLFKLPELTEIDELITLIILT